MSQDRKKSQGYEPANDIYERHQVGKVEKYLLEKKHRDENRFMFDQQFIAENNELGDYQDTDDKIDDECAFYNTQFNHISELEDVDMMNLDQFICSKNHQMDYIDPAEEHKEHGYQADGHHHELKCSKCHKKLEIAKGGFYHCPVYEDCDEHYHKQCAKQKEIDFSDFEAVQACLEEEGQKEIYKKKQRKNKELNRKSLPNIEIDQRIAPEVLAKDIKQQIILNQALMPEDIIYKYKAKKTLQELFLRSSANQLGFEKLVGYSDLGENPTRMVLDQQIILDDAKRIENMHVEYLQRNEKLFCMIRYVLKKNDIRKTILKIFDFEQPYYSDDLDKPNQNTSHNANFLTQKQGKQLDQKSIVRAKSLKKGVSFDFKPEVKLNQAFDSVQNLEIPQSKYMGIAAKPFLNVESVVKTKENSQDSDLFLQTGAIMHNQMTVKFGQWVFYYVIGQQDDVEEIKLMMYDLDNPDQEATSVNHQFLKKKHIQVYIPIVKGAEGKDEDIEEDLQVQALTNATKSEFEDLEVFGTSAILFNVNSKFIGDNSCNLNVSFDDAQEWAKKQLVVHLGKSKKGGEDILVSSIRRSEELTQYIVAVQTPFQNTENNVTFGVHENVLRDETEGRKNYFTLNVNQDDFVFEVTSQIPHQDVGEEFEDRVQKLEALKRYKTFKKQLFSELVGSVDKTVDIHQEVKRAQTMNKDITKELKSVAIRRQTIAHIKNQLTLPLINKKKEEVLKQMQEDSFAEIQFNVEVIQEQKEGGKNKIDAIEDKDKVSRESDDDVSESDKDYFERDQTIIAERIEFEEGLDECIIQWMSKVQSTEFKTYQIRNIHNRNYVYKSEGSKYASLLDSLVELQPRKTGQNQRKNLGFNLMLIQNNQNYNQSYQFQLLERKQNSQQFYLKFFVSQPKQNVRFRIIEEHDRIHQHPLVRGLEDSGHQEVIQLHPYFGNVFVDSDKYFLKDNQTKKLQIQTRDLNILIYNKKHYLSFFETLPQKNSKTIRTFYECKRRVQVRLQKYQQVNNNQKQLVIEIWNNSQIPVKVKNKKFGHKPQIEYQDGEVLYSEIVQSTFFDLQSLKDFSNYCPSSAIEKVHKDPKIENYMNENEKKKVKKEIEKLRNDVQKDGLYKQRYQILTMEDLDHDEEEFDKDLIYRIYEYELTWNELNPSKKSTKLRLVGRKQIVFNDEKINRCCILAPYYPNQNDYIINGTQLLSGHGDNNIVLDNFNAIDFQFKTGICNSGYKIYQDTKDDTDWKCILVESQINTCALPQGHQDDKVKVKDREAARENLDNHDIKRMFEYQFNVIFNMVPFDPLQSITLLDNTLDNTQHDHFAPLEILNGNSIIDHVLFHPQAIQEASQQSDCYPSIVNQFIKNQVQQRPYPGDKDSTHFYDILDKAFGQNKSWFRHPNEVWQDLVQTNPLFRCYDQNDNDIAITAITGALITKMILKQKMTLYMYEMVMQVLPIVIDTKGIDIEQYANYFIDATDKINFGIKMNEGVDGKILPKFAYEQYEIIEIQAEGKVSELDLRAFAARHIIALDEEDQEIHREQEDIEVQKKEAKLAGRKVKIHQDDHQKNQLKVKKECSDSDDDIAQDDCDSDGVTIELSERKYLIKKANNGTKDTRVKYFLIDFDSMHYLNKMRYIQGLNDSVICITEKILANTMKKINDKFFDYFDQAPIMRNLLDLYFIETQKFFAVQMAIFIFLFAGPFIAQMFMTTDSPWTIRILMFISCGAQVFFTIVAYILMTQLGPTDYLSDPNNVNQVLISFFFPVYTFFRFFDTSNMLPTDDGELTSMYAFFLFSNCFIIMSMTFKLFQLMKVDPKFGLLVQLVTQAFIDCFYFTIFMFIWIAVFSLILKILGGDSSQMVNKYQDINSVLAWFLQTFENGTGNIRNPTYDLWIEKYHCNVKTDDDVFLCTTSNKVVSIVTIYAIWFFWFVIQFVVFIILVNFLIVYIGNSYQNVMDSALKFKYQQICQQTKEYTIIKESFFGAVVILPFVLVANVEEDGDDASFGGLVSQVLDNIRRTNRSFKKEIECERDTLMKTIKSKYLHFDNQVKETDESLRQQIKQTQESLESGVLQTKKQMKSVQESLNGSILTQKQQVQNDFNDMWAEMMGEFNNLSQKMRDDMGTYKKELDDVNTEVQTFGTSLKESFNNVKASLYNQLNSVNSSIGSMNQNVQSVNQSVLDVQAGVKDAESSALAGINEVNQTVGGVGEALNNVKNGVMASVSNVEEGINKVKGNVESVASNVEKTNADVASKAAKAADKAAKQEAQFQQMEAEDAKRQAELEKKAAAKKSKGKAMEEEKKQGADKKKKKGKK